MTLFDSDDAERQSLSRRRVIRTLYPQITEAPLYFYATQADSASIRTVADQCAETGFEAIILSFGSGFNPSSTNASYIAQMAKDVEYVHSKGLIIGGCESLTHMAPFPAGAKKTAPVSADRTAAFFTNR